MKLTNNIPVINVTITSTSTGLKRTVPALLSTGSFITKLSKNIIQSIESVDIDEEFPMEIILEITGTPNSFNGKIPLYTSEEWNKEYEIIIGLDVLKHSQFSINGINQTFELNFN